LSCPSSKLREAHWLCSQGDQSSSWLTSLLCLRSAECVLSFLLVCLFSPSFLSFLFFLFFLFYFIPIILFVLCLGVITLQINKLLFWENIPFWVMPCNQLEAIPFSMPFCNAFLQCLAARPLIYSFWKVLPNASPIEKKGLLEGIAKCLDKAFSKCLFSLD